jgi:hypothetical protein
VAEAPRADAGLMQATTTAISLELSPDGDSVSGLARVADGKARRFSGWLGLLSTIEALIEADSQGEAQAEHEIG